ncbi:MAG: tRNA (N6-threonylcarbamoyladenosine(37)-N6)-methyltransferase TrmO [Chromatiales bacterium]|jgi:tRNA-Thr(GGU) m(6)t(6)A37 methyltransferase TsaA
MSRFEFEPIGYIASCFKEKFGIPRQSGLVPEARGILQIVPPYNRPEAFRELADYSHIWLTFVFHGNLRQQWKPTVRPPRLGGNQRVGVFASRSPFRPNPIGLSVVRLERLELAANRVSLHLGGIDLLDGTPVLDIKPYLPYADAIANARSGYAPAPPEEAYDLCFAAAAERALSAMPEEAADDLRKLIRHLLALDPRPGYRRGEAEQRRYGMRLLDYDLHWTIDGDRLIVLALDACQERNGA